ncbi:unnamed protein product, partial [Mesorhabditis belari]|uniref:Delta(3,5)-Delta(2,4)-dienoyl-CoA isomerase, mitochondrial n=1 Tax=Mesorhabditis belari TaxID=2138241 RepID=A0AAF3EYB8_9BILA
MYNFTCLKVEKLPNCEFVFHVQLNRPTKLNAMNMVFWDEIGKCFEQLSKDPDCRTIVLSGAGKAFSVGLDLKENDVVNGLNDAGADDFARKAFLLGRKIRQMQQCFTNINECPKPVIVVMHGYCLGGGVDLITACDIRIATKETQFSIKEVDVGIVADVGTLNRINKVCGNDSWIREVALTGRNFGAEEAYHNHLISRVCSTKEEALNEALKMAESIALKSPIAVQGTKINLNYSRDHSIQDSLNFVATWNQSQLFSEDVPKSAMATLMKSPFPEFSKL